MRKYFVFTILLVLASLLAACESSLTETQVSEIAAQAAKEEVEAIELPKQEQLIVEVVMPEAPQAEESEPVEEPVVNEPEVAPVPVSNSLVNPELFDSDSHPAGESTPGLFDIGVNADQIGIVFGWNLSWSENSIKGEGCEMVVLPSGWYENFEILDGRYEIYTLPSSDPTGWTQVLIDQRVAEQATHYGCDPNATPPTWAE